MTIFVPGGAFSANTTLANLVSLVQYELSDTEQASLAKITVSEDDDATTVFHLPHENVSVSAVYLDDVLQATDTDYTVDERAGKLTFTTAPGESTVIEAHYTHTRWYEDDITQAVNDAVYHLFPYFYVYDLQTDDGETVPTTFTTTPSTYEYEIRADTEAVAGLDWRSSSSFPWKRLRRSRYEMVRDDTTRYIRLHDSPATGYFRVHAIKRPSPFAESSDTLADIGLNERAARPLILYACQRLLNMTLASRVRSDVAISTQGEGQVPPYEIARAANSYMLAYQTELESSRMPPWSVR